MSALPAAAPSSQPRRLRGALAGLSNLRSLSPAICRTPASEVVECSPVQQQPSTPRGTPRRSTSKRRQVVCTPRGTDRTEAGYAQSTSSEVSVGASEALKLPAVHSTDQTCTPHAPQTARTPRRARTLRSGSSSRSSAALAAQPLAAAAVPSSPRPSSSSSRPRSRGTPRGVAAAAATIGTTTEQLGASELRLLTTMFGTSLKEDAARELLDEQPELSWLAQCMERAPLPQGWTSSGADQASPTGYYVGPDGETTEDHPCTERIAEMARLMASWRVAPQKAHAVHESLGAIHAVELAQATSSRNGWSGPHTDAASGEEFWTCEKSGRKYTRDPGADAEFLARVAQRLQQAIPLAVAQSAPDECSNYEDQPGWYVLVQRAAVAPSMQLAKENEFITELDVGTVVQVLEVQLLEEERRVRGRIEVGWVSLSSKDDSYRWADYHSTFYEAVNAANEMNPEANKMLAGLGISRDGTENRTPPSQSTSCEAKSGAIEPLSVPEESLQEEAVVEETVLGVASSPPTPDRPTSPAGELLTEQSPLAADVERELGPLQTPPAMTSSVSGRGSRSPLMPRGALSLDVADDVAEHASPRTSAAAAAAPAPCPPPFAPPPFAPPPFAPPAFGPPGAATGNPEEDLDLGFGLSIGTSTARRDGYSSKESDEPAFSAMPAFSDRQRAIPQTPPRTPGTPTRGVGASKGPRPRAGCSRYTTVGGA